METLASDIDLEEIDLDPETEEEEIEQCIGIILNTFQNSVPWNEYNTLRQTTNRR